MGIAVEEPPECVLELRELLFVGVASIILTVIVQHVDGLIAEELADLGVGVYHFTQVGLLEVGVQSLVAKPRVKHNRGERGECLEPQPQMEELVEEEGSEWQYIFLESVGDARPSFVPESE